MATTSAAAALLALLPVSSVGPTVTPVAQAASAAAPAAAIDSAALLAAAVPVVPAAAPVTHTRIAQVAVATHVIPAHPALAAGSVSSARTSAVQLALSKVGAPYVWGATGPSAFDCSGLIKWAFGQAGIDVPRTSRALSQAGTPVARADLQPGDLVFFYSPVSHAGIYIGDGQMVHASTSGKPVAVSPIEGREFNSARRY